MQKIEFNIPDSWKLGGYIAAYRITMYYVDDTFPNSFIPMTVGNETDLGMTMIVSCSYEA